MADEQERRRGAAGIGDGIRSGIGVLTALAQAVEETFQEAVERGDLSPERAGQAARDAARRFQEGIGDARERLDLVSRKDFEDLRAEVAELRQRLDAMEPGGDQIAPDSEPIPIDEG